MNFTSQEITDESVIGSWCFFARGVRVRPGALTANHGEGVLKAHDARDEQRGLVVATEEGHLADARAPWQRGHA